jgi:hypothetical protein
MERDGQRRRVLVWAGVLTATLAAAPVAVAAPPAPANVRATPPMTNLPPHLEWDTADGATSYTVYRLDGSSCVPTPGNPAKDLGDKLVTNFTDAVLESRYPADPNHTYAYYVVANGDGTSGPSSCVTVVYDTLAPTIGGLSAITRADGSIAVSWTVDDLYQPITLVLRRGGPNLPAPSSPTDGVAVCDTPPGTTSCTDAAVQSGAQYGYRLFASDPAGNPASSDVTAMASDTTPPSAPDGLVLAPGDGQIAVSWNPVAVTGANSDLAGYRVVRGSGAAPPASVTDGTTVCDIASPVVTSCLVGGLVDGQAVGIAVFAHDEVPNWSAAAPGAQASATPIAPPSPPAPPPPQPTVVDHQPPGRPTLLSVHLSASGVTLTWRNPRDADLDHLVVVRNAHHRPRGPSDGRRTTVGRGTHATLPAERGERFHLALYAYDHAGNVSQPTALDVAVPKLLPAPGAAFTRAPELSWAAVAKATYYNVVVTRGGKRVAVGWPTGTHWRPARLRPGVYRWFVWPGFGPKKPARYGRLIGTATFRIR